MMLFTVQSLHKLCMKGPFDRDTTPTSAQTRRRMVWGGTTQVYYAQEGELWGKSGKTN